MKHKQLIIHVDGAIAGGKHSGVAAIARDPHGRFVGWVSRKMRRMTNMEAEYHAALLGIELAKRLKAKQFVIVSDAQVMVHQVQGRIRVLSQRLRPLHQQVCVATSDLPHVQFRHVPRDNNRLADALAADAVEGRTVS